MQQKVIHTCDFLYSNATLTTFNQSSISQTLRHPDLSRSLAERVRLFERFEGIKEIQGQEETQGTDEPNTHRFRPRTRFIRAQKQVWHSKNKKSMGFPE